ncbi:MAG: branched-chain amino acid ABC transporter permease [Acidimicrobiia bacterium]
MSELEPLPLEPLDPIETDGSSGSRARGSSRASGPAGTAGPGGADAVVLTSGALARSALTVRQGSGRWWLLSGGSIGIAFAVVTVLVFVLPVLEARLLSRFVALGVALLGLQFVVGRAGQLSLCHGAFVGVGSYGTTIAISRYELPHLVGVAVAPALGFVAGCFVGLLALRIKATYLGPVTLSVAVVFPMLVKRFSWFTGGSGGLPLVRQMEPPAWMGLQVPEFYKWNHLIIVAIAVVALVVARNVIGSPVGLAVQAVAQNPLSAATSGVNVTRVRVVSYGWGAAFGALGGGLLVIDTPVVGADNYDLFRSLGYYAAVMVGGAASMIGAVFGAALLVGVPWLMESYSIGASPNLVLGVLLVASILVAPGGLAVAVRDYVAGLIDVRDPLQDRGGTDADARFAPSPSGGPPTDVAAGPSAHYGADDERLH